MTPHKPIFDASAIRLYGRILLLRDFTELKRAQQPLSQELRVHATLQERARMARELHDAVSQQLAFISLQGQAARGLLASGNQEEADSYLGRLVEVAGAAQADVRGLVDDHPLPRRDAQPALQSRGRGGGHGAGWVRGPAEGS